MKQIIGYYSDMAFVMEKANIKSEEFLNSKVELCFGRIVSETKLKEEKTKDIIEGMLHDNYGTIIEMNDTIAKILFNHPIPENIFDEYYEEKEKIYYQEESE